MAVVQAPRSLPRVVGLPEDCADSPYDFVFLSSIIHAHVEEHFPGMKALGCYQFRVTRDSDLFVDEEAVDDLLQAVGGNSPQGASAMPCASNWRTTARRTLAGFSPW